MCCSKKVSFYLDVSHRKNKPDTQRSYFSKTEAMTVIIFVFQNLISVNSRCCCQKVVFVKNTICDVDVLSNKTNFHINWTLLIPLHFEKILGDIAHVSNRQELQNLVLTNVFCPIAKIKFECYNTFLER